jgi:hypothetical protein
MVGVERRCQAHLARRGLHKRRCRAPRLATARMSASADCTSLCRGHAPPELHDLLQPKPNRPHRDLVRTARHMWSLVAKASLPTRASRPMSSAAPQRPIKRRGPTMAPPAQRRPPVEVLATGQGVGVHAQGQGVSVHAQGQGVGVHAQGQLVEVAAAGPVQALDVDVRASLPSQDCDRPSRPSRAVGLVGLVEGCLLLRRGAARVLSSACSTRLLRQQPVQGCWQRWACRPALCWGRRPGACSAGSR